MVGKKKVLGRGLEALIGQPKAAAAESNVQQLQEIPLDLIQPGRYQPRSAFDPEKLEALAESIKSQGVVQPVVLYPLDGGGYELIAGERRWRAAQLAGLERLPAVIKDVPDETILAIALIENVQREDLNPLEEANALQRLVEEFGLTHQQAADAVGRSRTAVSNLIRLLELAAGVKQLIDRRQLDMGHARALLALPQGQQLATARMVVARGMSVRQTEQLVKRLLAGNPSANAARKPPSADILRLQNELTEKLGARVSLQHQSSGKGRLTIQYNSVDELDGILDRIK